ncbi:MAG: fyuA [Bacteroidetes bacterium]|nr:fyuA [Bacteroidota bacterium]
MRIERIIYGMVLVLVALSSHLISYSQQRNNDRDSCINLKEIFITSECKFDTSLRNEALSSSSFDIKNIENNGSKGIKDIALNTPNLFIPDYGSKTTSSIYVRGIGSRIDNPIIGYYMDNIPILNKSNFDFEFWDIKNIDIIRGAQSTLYGLNTLGGIINITSLSPMNYQGKRVEFETGNGGLFRTKTSVYYKKSDKLAFSIGMYYGSLSGFFTNTYTNKKADWSRDFGTRIKIQYRFNKNWTLYNNTIFSSLNQGGYAYSEYNIEKKQAFSISYNDKCGYDRKSLINGTKINYRNNKINLLSISSIQILDDKMLLDNDFSQKALFTLNQTQREIGLSQEFILKPISSNKNFDWIIGSYSFSRHLDLQSPVRFREDGVNEIILYNINNGLHHSFPYDNILFREKEFDANSSFIYPRYGTALYCQGSYKYKNLKLIGGLRMDYENILLDYKNDIRINYLFTLTMDEYKPLNTILRGKESQETLELLPKIALVYDINDDVNIYATISKGYKSGGYNTQIFSDILSNKMREDMLRDLGITLENSQQKYSIDEIIKYRPEYIWNYEMGSHFDLLNNKLRGNIALFYMDCINQQLTIFPDDKSMGRMMTNAGRSKSMGVETSIRANIDNLSLNLSYGFIHARFIEYKNGQENYSNKKLPYSPSNTISIGAYYFLILSSHYIDDINFGISYSGAGKIYFDEANSVSQEYYSLIDANINLHRDRFNLRLWARNITNTDYNTFYFMSLGKSYVQKGRPIQFGLTLIFNT